MSYPREVRVCACADYLIGLPLKEICHKYDLAFNTVWSWVKKSDHFKLRETRRDKS